jgi:hypothetical protein
MKKTFFLLIFLPIFSFAQNDKAEKEAVIAVIKQMFDGMRKGDSTMVRTAFASQVRMQTIFMNKEGKPAIRAEDSVDGFVKTVGSPHPEIFDERIKDYEVKIDDRMAAVWTPYEFYLGSKFSHCGVNSFQLFKGETGWKIIYIVDTRRKECK